MFLKNTPVVRNRSRSSTNTLDSVLGIVAIFAFSTVIKYPVITGSFSVTGTATESPATVSLSDTSPTRPSGIPHCGGQDDGRPHMPSDWAAFTPPSSVGAIYTDALAATMGGTGCVVKRLTVGGKTVHYYSTLEPMSAGDNYIFVSGAGTCNNGGWCIIDKDGNVVINGTSMPGNATQSALYTWSATDDKSFYYSCERNQLCKATIKRTNSLSRSSIHTFSEYSYITVPDATRISYDGTSIGLVGEHAGSGTQPVDIFTFNLKTGTKYNTFTTSTNGSCAIANAPQPMGTTDLVNDCIHKIIMSTDNRIAITWHPNTEPNLDADCKAAFQAKYSCTSIINVNSTLSNLQSGTTHTDSFLSLDGTKNNWLMLWDPSPNGTNANDHCPNNGGHSTINESTLTSSCIFTTNFSGGHISTAGTGPTQPWALISWDDATRTGSGSPEYFSSSPRYATPTGTCSQYGVKPPNNCWFVYESEIILLRIDSVGNSSGLGGTPGKVWRLAWSRTRDSSSSFWGQQRAALSRDGKYVIFDSNMAYSAGNCSNPSDLGCDDVYMIGPLF